MKSVLLFAHDDDGQEARLQAALDVTRALGAHLTCLDVLTPATALSYDTFSTVAAAALIEEENDREAANRSRLEARLANEDVNWSWQDATGFLEDTIESASGFADLIVLSNRMDEHTPLRLRQLTGQVIKMVDRPVLAVPTDIKRLDVMGPVLIAWDGSREADEALRDAVPLLKLSSDVILFDLDESDGAAAVTSAASYLSRHDIHVRVEIDKRDPDGQIYSDILKKAHEVGAAYIVMGAFGHSPTVEAIFGGVTRSMLAQSDIPLLLAH